MAHADAGVGGGGARRGTRRPDRWRRRRREDAARRGVPALGRARGRHRPPGPRLRHADRHALRAGGGSAARRARCAGRVGDRARMAHRGHAARAGAAPAIPVAAGAPGAGRRGGAVAAIRGRHPVAAGARRRAAHARSDRRSAMVRPRDVRPAALPGAALRRSAAGAGRDVESRGARAGRPGRPAVPRTAHSALGGRDLTRAAGRR